MRVLLLALMLFVLLQNCSFIPFIGKKNDLGFTIYGDPKKNFFLKKEIKDIGEDGIFPYARKGFWNYVKVYYDMNKDGKADVIQYHCLVRAEWNLSDGLWEMTWQFEWFRKEVDSDCDGEFDYILEENENKRINVYDYSSKIYIPYNITH